MPKFRRKTTVIEAEQWRPEKKLEYVLFDLFGPYVVTIHQEKAHLTDGDWILPEPDGIHHYPVKDDVFKNTYEPIDSIQDGTKPRGLYGKYRIEKSDGSPVDPKAIYFTLRLDTDPHARAAARAYVESCRAENPELAVDLEKVLEEVDSG